ncbi:hypothetical protein DU508_04940 [Pedobacter chinensis]|uniref:Uncharacterized protein n=1 Tax=Pedobacter chinensis TaxID=2282421 RepID=A0A369Q0L6_9SPHI|nr:hypothetical protein DU508_04940 [Pedobacter chinensis]
MLASQVFTAFRRKALGFVILSIAKNLWPTGAVFDLLEFILFKKQMNTHFQKNITNQIFYYL